MNNPRDFPPGLIPAGATDFEGARTQLYTGFRQFDIDLTAAGDRVIELAGDFLYCDADPTRSSGYVRLQPNAQQSSAQAELYVQAGFALAQPFTQIRLIWPAQPGKRLRLLYATGARVVPANVANVNVTDNPLEFDYQALAPSQYNVNLAGAGLTTIFAPSVNTAGIIVWDAAFVLVQALVGAGGFTVLAKTSAPGNSHDGKVVLTADNASSDATNLYSGGRREKPVRIQPGNGLYYYQDAASTGGIPNPSSLRINYVLLS